MTNTTESKQLDDNPGHHVVVRHDYDWLARPGSKLSDPIQEVVFWTHEGGFSFEVSVHWTRAFAYMAAELPGYHTVNAVRTESGRRIHAKTYTVGTYSNDEWKRLPKVLQKPFRISELMSGATLLEIKGAGTFSYSNRTEADVAAFLEAQKSAKRPY